MRLYRRKLLTADGGFFNLASVLLFLSSLAELSPRGAALELKTVDSGVSNFTDFLTCASAAALAFLEF